MLLKLGSQLLNADRIVVVDLESREVPAARAGVCVTLSDDTHLDFRDAEAEALRGFFSVDRADDARYPAAEILGLEIVDLTPAPGPAVPGANGRDLAGAAAKAAEAPAPDARQVGGKSRAFLECGAAVASYLSDPLYGPDRAFEVLRRHGYRGPPTTPHDARILAFLQLLQRDALWEVESGMADLRKRRMDAAPTH